MLISSRLLASIAWRLSGIKRLAIRNSMQYFIWYDDTPKKPVVEKIDAAIAAYVERFKTRPNLVLVNAIDYLEVADMTVRSERTVQPNSFWVGQDDAADRSTV